ncbi:MAG: polysaccharide deacetylase family protein [Planctomycetaceae bacterium]
MTPANSAYNRSGTPGISRRSMLAGALTGTLAAAAGHSQDQKPSGKARIAITFDLEMSRMYPTRDITEWDFQKGNLNEPTKQYALQAARLANDRDAQIHFFCVGRVLEQANIDWLKDIAAMGHPIGNHTYDHVNVWAQTPQKTQFRFERSPWLVEGRTAQEIIRENIRVTTLAMKQRAGITPDGFRTPGGSSAALDGREDLQQMLLDEGFTWVSSKYPPHKSSTAGTEPTDEVFTSIVDALPHAQPYVYTTQLIEIPMSPISDVGAFRTSRWKLEHFLKSVRQCVEWTIEQGAVFDFLCHPSIMYVEDPQFETVKLICDLVRQAGDKAEIVGLSTIAKHVVG